MTNQMSVIDDNESLEAGNYARVGATDAQIRTARRYPRETESIRQKIRALCARQRVAEDSQYVYTRGTTLVTGGSIRLAEAIATTWENLHYGWIEIDRLEGKSHVVSWCTDLETNTTKAVFFIVPHVRDTKKAQLPITRLRDVNDHVANYAQRRLRQCIFAIIPNYIAEDAKDWCDRTMLDSIGDITQARSKMIEMFAQYGVQTAHLTAFLGHPVDSIRPSEVLRLRRAYVSIRDGICDVGDLFGGASRPVPEVTQGVTSSDQEDPIQRAHQVVQTPEFTNQKAARRAEQPKDVGVAPTDPPIKKLVARSESQEPAGVVQVGSKKVATRSEAPQSMGSKDEQEWKLSPIGKGRIIAACDKLGIRREEMEVFLGSSLMEANKDSVNRLRKTLNAIKNDPGLREKHFPLNNEKMHERMEGQDGRDAQPVIEDVTTKDIGDIHSSIVRGLDNPRDQTICAITDMVSYALEKAEVTLDKFSESTRGQSTVGKVIDKLEDLLHDLCSSAENLSDYTAIYKEVETLYHAKVWSKAVTDALYTIVDSRVVDYAQALIDKTDNSNGLGDIELEIPDYCSDACKELIFSKIDARQAQLDPDASSPS